MAEVAAAGARPRGRGDLRRRLAGWDSVIMVIAVVVLIVASASVQNFGTSRNFTFLVLDLLPVALVALPMTFIVITGEIDLSVASTLGLTSALMGYLWNHGLSIQMIMPLCVVFGAVLGALNGFLITGLGLPSLAVTIGTLALYRGLAFVVLGDRAVADFPFDYTGWVTGTLNVGSASGGVPHVLIVLVILAVIFGVVLHATPFGRSVFAMGASGEAAQFAGIRVKRIKTLLFVLSGVICAMTGALWTFRLSTAVQNNGLGLELDVVAVALLAGVSIFGGKGSIGGVVLAVLAFAGLQNALLLTNFNQEATGIVIGALLLVSVFAPNAGRLWRAGPPRWVRGRSGHRSPAVGGGT
jgi:rhamnose transport system permease protein